MFPVKLVCKNFLKGERKKGKEGRDIRASFSSFPFIYNGFRFEKGGDGKKMDFIRIFPSSNMCSLLLFLFWSSRTERSDIKRASISRRS